MIANRDEKFTYMDEDQIEIVMPPEATKGENEDEEPVQPKPKRGGPVGIAAAKEGPIMRLWDAVKQAFGGTVRPSATEALALASVSRDTVGALTDEELHRLERLCHDAIAEAVAPVGREEEGLPIFVVSERGIGMNPEIGPPTSWGFRLMVTPEGIEARTGGE